MMVLFSGKGMKMKVQKYEIARVIDKLKSIVQKNDQFPALGGILVKDGYLIASNSEITMKVKLEASEGSYFIIPMKAFDLIKNLPDGEIDISATDKNVVMIKIGAIKNKYQSYPPEEFNFDITEDPEADGVELNGKKIMEAIGHVIYAAADGGANTQMTGIYFEGTDSGVSLAALDGHVVAVDSVKAEGAKDMKLIVPKATAKKLISIVRDLNLDKIQEDLWNIMEECENIRWYTDSDDGNDSLINALDGDEDEAYEFKMAFADLCAECERMQEDLQEEWIPNCFDMFFVAAGTGENFGGLLGWDSFEGDYFGIDGTDAWAEDEAKKKMKTLTKDELIAAARQCFKVYQSYIGLRNRYDSLKAAIDILRDQNTGFLQTIKEIERLYEAASKEQGITAKYSTEWKEFERYTDALPQEAWIQ